MSNLQIKRKMYLGDAVYAEMNEGYLILTTEDGVRATNTIYLERAVLENLMSFLSQPGDDSPITKEG